MMHGRMFSDLQTTDAQYVCTGPEKDKGNAAKPGKVYLLSRIVIIALLVGCACYGQFGVKRYFLYEPIESNPIL